jgi:hypothetical protein
MKTVSDISIFPERDDDVLLTPHGIRISNAHGALTLHTMYVSQMELAALLETAVFQLRTDAENSREAEAWDDLKEINERVPE